MTFLYLTRKLTVVQEEKNDIFLQEIVQRTAQSTLMQLQGRMRFVQNSATALGEHWSEMPPQITDTDNKVTVWDKISPLKGVHLRYDPGLVSRLRDIGDTLKAKRVALALPDGDGMYSTGMAWDKRERPNLGIILRGQSVISPIILDPEDGQPMNVIGVPVFVHGRAVAALFVVLDSEKLSPALEIPLFSGQGHTYVLNAQGQGVSLNFGKRLTQNNLFQGLEPLVTAEKLQNMRQRMGEEKSGTLDFCYRNTDYYLMYTPLGMNQWYVVGFVPGSYVNSQTTTSISFMLGLSALTGLLFLGLVCYVIVIQRRMRRDNLQQAARMATLMGNIPGGVVRSRDDAVWTLEEYNEGFLNLIGYSAAEVAELFNSQMFRIIHPKDREMVQRVQDEGRGVSMEYRVARKDGSVIWVAEHSQLVHENGESYWCAVMLDISASRNAQERRRLDEERYRILFEMSDAILYEYDMRSGVLHTTRQFFEKFGYAEPESLAAHHPITVDYIHPEDRPVFDALHKSLQEGQSTTEALVRVLANDGRWLWCHVQQTALLDAQHHCIKALGKITNVDAETRALHQLREEVQRDSFTGLYNKIATAGLVDEALNDMENAQVHDNAPHAVSALCVIDVDNFKSVNDCMGHSMGDTVLKELSASLGALFRASDIVGRVGGDEFVIFMRDVKNERALQAKMQQVLAAFRQSFDYTDGAQIRISASVGVALWPQQGDSFSELFRHADKALYRSKKTKDVCSYYDEAVDGE